MKRKYYKKNLRKGFQNIFYIYIFLIKKKVFAGADFSWLFITAFKILELADLNFSHQFLLIDQNKRWTCHIFIFKCSFNTRVSHWAEFN